MGISNIGEDSGDLLIGLIGESGHAGGEVVFHALDLDRALEAAELDTDEVLNGAGHPLGASEGRASGGAFAVLAVAGSADDELLLADFEEGGIDGGEGC